MSVDLRRLSYRLDAVRAKTAWELDTKLLEMRAQCQRLDVCKAAIDQVRRTRTEAVISVQQMHRLHVDPRTHASALSFLVLLDERLVDMNVECHEAAQALSVVREQCAGLQRRLDQLDEHRRKHVAEFVMVEDARAQAIADADWLLRAGWVRGREALI